MKALSIKQPFVGLIAVGEKNLEVRSWKLPSKYLNRDILICASQSKPDPGVANCDEDSRFFATAVMICRGIAICTVRFRSCQKYRPVIDDLSACLMPDYAAKICAEKTHYAWEIGIESVRIVKPFAVKGRLGFFDVDKIEVKDD